MPDPDAPARVERGRLGEIPLYSARVTGLTRAGLLFRVGRGDEPPRRGGVTHLVEHLSLFPMGQQPYDYNAQVDAAWTAYWAFGTAEQVEEHLHAVVENLQDLPLDRLETEARILRDEGNQRQPGAFEHHAWLRYGLWGPGMGFLDELGLYNPDEDAVQAWSDSRFTSANAALVWTGPTPPEFELELPAGIRSELVEPKELVDRPTWASGADSLVTASFALTRRPGTGAAMRILARRLEQRVRYELGLSYGVTLDFQPLTGTRVLASLAATTGPRDAGAVGDAFVTAIAAFLADGPAVEELPRDAAFVETDDAPFPAFAEGIRMALDELMGAEVRTDAEITQSASNVTPDMVGHAFGEASIRRILTLPRGVPGPTDGYWPYPTLLGPPPRAARIFLDLREPAFDARPKFHALTIGTEGVGVVRPGGDGFGMRWSDAVVAIDHGHRGIALLDGTGSDITVRPDDWWYGSEAVGLMHPHIPPDRLVVVPSHGPLAPTVRRSVPTIVLTAIATVILFIMGSELINDPGTRLPVAGALGGWVFVTAGLVFPIWVLAAYGFRRAAVPGALVTMALLVVGVALGLVVGFPQEWLLVAVLCLAPPILHLAKRRTYAGLVRRWA